jgi:hypothetical protein
MLTAELNCWEKWEFCVQFFYSFDKDQGITSCLRPAIAGLPGTSIQTFRSFGSNLIFT